MRSPSMAAGRCMHRPYIQERRPATLAWSAGILAGIFELSLEAMGSARPDDARRPDDACITPTGQLPGFPLTP